MSCLLVSCLLVTGGAGFIGANFVLAQVARGATVITLDNVLLIVTEWKEFRSPDFEAIRAKLRHPLIIDGRNMYDPAMVRSFGLQYDAIGRQ